MNIIICTSQVALVRGGAEVLTDGLRAALQQAGHQVETVGLPFKWYPHRQLEQAALMWRTLELETPGRKADLVICTKFPTWAVKHSNKVVWLVHQHRQAYDWYGTPLSDFGTDEADRRSRRVVLDTDGLGLGEARAIYTISQNVATRLSRYNGLKGLPLYPPLKHDRFYNAGYGDYIFTVGRLDSAKRNHSLLEALAKTSGLRAVIAGSGPDANKLQALAKRLKVSERVEFVGRVDEDELVELYAHALAVFYAPVDEDYGYVTVEGMRSHKPVITAPDSGGVLEFVRDGVNGYVCHDAAEMGAAFEKLQQDKELASRLGRAGFETVQALVPSWAEVAATLTQV